MYSAARIGADRANGVDLRIQAPSTSVDSLKLLTSGRSDFAIVDIHDLGLAVEAGEQVLGVGAIVQRPLAAVIASRSIRRPRELEGRRVGVTGLPSDEAVLRATVEHDGGDYDRVRLVTIGFSAVPSLVAGKVDAVVAFWNAEGVALRERGLPTREFRVDRYGAPRYPELVLAARRETIEREPGLVRDVVAALAEGTRAALADSEAAAEEITAASEGEPALVESQLEAIEPALRPPLRLDPRALRAWSRFDVRFGILERPIPVSRTFALEAR